MQLSYLEHGMQCDFTLMTIGDYRADSVTPAPDASRQVSAAPSSKLPARQQSALPTVERKTTTMPPPCQPASRSLAKEPPPSQRVSRPSPPPPKASLDPESLFLHQYDDEDRQWGEKNYDEEEDTVGWSAGAVNVSALRPSSPAIILIPATGPKFRRCSTKQLILFTVGSTPLKAVGGS